MSLSRRTSMILIAVALVAVAAVLAYWIRQGLPSPTVENEAVSASAARPEVASTLAPAPTPEAAPPAEPPLPSDDPIADQASWAEFQLAQQLPALAAKHLLRAALCGDPASQARLADLYATGTGVGLSLERALLWASLAGELGAADETLGARVAQYRASLPAEAWPAVDAAIEAWLVRRPDQTLACQAAAMPPDSEFQTGLFALD